MRKHAAPAPALFSRPETALAAATLTVGAMVGALPAPAPVAAAVGVPLALVLALLAAAPAPGERATDPRHRATRSIPAAVYTRTAIHLLVALFSAPKPAGSPLESEALAGSRPLDLRPLGVGRMLVGGWADAGRRSWSESGAQRRVGAEM